MDWDQFSNNLKSRFPITVAITSFILSAAEFLQNFGIKSLVIITFISLLSAVGLSYAVIWYARRITYINRPTEFSILKSEDICEILDIEGRNAIYRRKLTVKVNNTSPVFLAYPATTDGLENRYKAYNCSNPSLRYDVSVSRSGGRRALFINFGHTLQKNEVINDLCIEWYAQDAFISEHEAISVNLEPGQESGIIRVILPENRPPLSTEWFVTYARNPLPIKRGMPNIHQNQDKKYVLQHEFFRDHSLSVELQCTVSWKYSGHNL